jgi:6-phosphofructokinase 1
MIISSIVKSKIKGIEYGILMINEGLLHFMEEEEILNSGINFTYENMYIMNYETQASNQYL